jgi:hypothetical protein
MTLMTHDSQLTTDMVFIRYLRERFPLRIFGAAATLQTGAAMWASGAEAASGTIGHGAVLSLLLLLQWRLWDDLEDRDRDRATHPNRVLVRTSPTPFRRALIVLSAINAVLVAVGDSRVALVQIALLNGVSCAAYRSARLRIPDVAWRFAILPIKYPVFVTTLATVLGAPPPGRLVTVAAVSFASACGYEALHNWHVAAGATS